jgi:crotonobetainyl-CoA:carnitine CoA-transferase CaiB-like acyl-CoA transferase
LNLIKRAAGEVFEGYFVGIDFAQTVQWFDQGNNLRLADTASAKECVALLDAVGIPGGPVFGYEQTINDPHVLARKMVHDIDHPIIGPMKTLGLPIKSSGALGSIRMPAPWLGQHSASVLAELGYSAQDTEALFQQGAVFDQYRDKARANA